MPTPIALATNSGLLDVSQFIGRDWIDSVNQAVAAISAGTLLIPDSLKGNATTIGNIPNGFNIVFEGVGPFGLDRLNVGSFVKIFGHGTRLVAQNINDTLINQTTQAILQTSDSFEMRGIILDGAGLGGTTGLYLGGGTAKGRIADCEFTGLNCGWRIDGAQFISASKLHFYNNFVGLKIYSIANAGGGNSNTFEHCTFVGNTVGRILSDLLGNIGQGDNRFIGCSDLSNAVAEAIFGNTNTATSYHKYGSPEQNGTGGDAPSATFPLVIDGNTIPSQATYYASNAAVEMESWSVSDASSTPEFLMQNGSTLVLRNVRGYGTPTGQLVNCDATSGVSFEGRCDCIGTSRGVLRYPDAVKASNVSKYIGTPLIIKNPLVANAFTANPMTLAFGDTLGAVASTAQDPLYGPISTVIHAASQGSQDGNRFLFNPAFTLAAISDICVSILIKASVACSYSVGLYGNNLSQVPTPLTTNWQRLVFVLPAVPSGNVLLVGFPSDASGPTISLTGLQIAVGQQAIAQILSSGSINTNGH